jgi:hypothetical protein
VPSRTDSGRRQRPDGNGISNGHLHQDDNLAYSTFSASVTIGGLAAFYRTYRRDPTSVIPEVAAKTWKGALVLAAFTTALTFAFLPLAGAITMALILPPTIIGLIRVFDRIGLRISAPFERRCSSCSAPVAITATYCTFCGSELKQQT